MHNLLSPFFIMLKALENGVVNLIESHVFFLLRLQRVQEERSRRNTNRYFDETMSGNDLNSIYSNDTINNQTLSSYMRHGDQTAFMSSTSSTTQQNTIPLNSYAQSGNIITAVSSSTPTHLTYFQTNPV